MTLRRPINCLKRIENYKPPSNKSLFIFTPRFLAMPNTNYLICCCTKGKYQDFKDYQLSHTTCQLSRTSNQTMYICIFATIAVLSKCIKQQNKYIELSESNQIRSLEQKHHDLLQQYEAKEKVCESLNNPNDHLLTFKSFDTSTLRQRTTKYICSNIETPMNSCIIFRCMQ